MTRIILCVMLALAWPAAADERHDMQGWYAEITPTETGAVVTLHNAYSYVQPADREPFTIETTYWGDVISITLQVRHTPNNEAMTIVGFSREPIRRWQGNDWAEVTTCSA